MFKKVALLVLFQASQILAWNGETHLMTAMKAYEILNEKDPAALKRAETILKKFSD